MEPHPLATRQNGVVRGDLAGCPNWRCDEGSIYWHTTELGEFPPIGLEPSCSVPSKPLLRIFARLAWPLTAWRWRFCGGLRHSFCGKCRVWRRFLLQRWRDL